MFYLATKRMVDFLGAFFALLLFSPFICGLALLIKYEDPGPVIFKQPRVGRNGKPFYIHKLRSMVLNSDEVLQRSGLLEKFKKNNWKLPSEEDPRVLKIGRFIRKFSLDEMIQFWDVLIGNMSIVGPRPFRFEELEMQKTLHPETEADIQSMLTVKPGITGPWQIGGRNFIDFVSRVEIEAAYAKRHSLFYDLGIIFKTPFKVIYQDGVI